MKRTRIVPVQGWFEFASLLELLHFRDLILILMTRDIKLRYKQTILGITWVILQPLISSLIFAIIFGRFAKLPSGDVPYLLFVFAAMLPWRFFAEALQRGGNSLIADSRLVSKVYFPRAAVPIASVASVLIDFLVGLVVMLVMMPFYGYVPTLNMLFLPLLMLHLLIISLGASLFFAALNVYYRDFMYMLPFLIQVWMYATPVVYAADIVPEKWQGIYALNPLVGVIAAFRWALLSGNEFPWTVFSISIIVGNLFFLGGMVVFQRIEQRFADVI